MFREIVEQCIFFSFLFSFDHVVMEPLLCAERPNREEEVSYAGYTFDEETETIYTAEGEIFIEPKDR